MNKLSKLLHQNIRKLIDITRYFLKVLSFVLWELSNVTRKMLNIILYEIYYIMKKFSKVLLWGYGKSGEGLIYDLKISFISLFLVLFFILLYQWDESKFVVMPMGGCIAYFLIRKIYIYYKSNKNKD